MRASTYYIHTIQKRISIYLFDLQSTLHSVQIQKCLVRAHFFSFAGAFSRWIFMTV